METARARFQLLGESCCAPYSAGTAGLTGAVQAAKQSGGCRMPCSISLLVLALNGPLKNALFTGEV